MFFDYDGTLVQGGINLRSIKEAIAETSNSPLFLGEIQLLERRWRKTDTQLQDDLIQPICDRLGITPRTVIQAYEAIRLRHYSKPAFMDGVTVVLSAAEKFPITGLVTNQNSAIGRLAVAARLPKSDRPIADYMNVIVYQGDLGNHKPNPAGYATAIALARRQPLECLAIEDTARGVEAAKKAGIPVVQVGANLRSSNTNALNENTTPDFVADSLESVAIVLEKIFHLRTSKHLYYADNPGVNLASDPL